MEAARRSSVCAVSQTIYRFAWHIVLRWTVTKLVKALLKGSRLKGNDHSLQRSSISHSFLSAGSKIDLLDSSLPRETGVPIAEMGLWRSSRQEGLTGKCDRVSKASAASPVFAALA